MAPGHITAGGATVAQLTQVLSMFAQRIVVDKTGLTGGYDIDLTFTADAEDEEVGLGAEIRREVWLIFKESVNNVARHSGCTRAEISVRIAHQRLELTVADNGRGFSPDVAAEGHGLASIRQRAARIGGTLEIESKPGGGTRVSVGAPIGMRRRPRNRVG